MSKRPRKQRAFAGVNKDPLDLRDLMYEGSLRELPFAVDNRRKVPVVLNQGQEGACTGFGLAAVVNFLYFNRSDLKSTQRRLMRQKEHGASARMLYEMAKRHDEWKGENYDGSSIRGAMKGWQKHGVCTWKQWPYKESDAGRLTPERQLQALGRPLGSYFRVRHLHLNQMHSALNEAGILYASAGVHEGWYDVSARTGKIPYSSEKAGAHAFAIVGFDGDGFWIQNSWGPSWGLKGFCHISYDDWLENGYDCWVAQLGAPTSSAAVEGKAERKRTSGFDYIPHHAVVLSAIRPHFINLGNDGRFSDGGDYTTDKQEVDGVVLGGFKKAAMPATSPAKLLLYAHGGLNNEKASASRIATLLPYFQANGIYPVHFMWESGLADSLRGILEDAHRRGRFQGWTDKLKDRFFDLLDEALELAASPLGKPIWRQMKDNATRATADAEGGARYAARALAQIFGELPKTPELHLVGHSAGSILLGRLVPCLAELGIPVKTFTLFAPACTNDFFKQQIKPHVGAGVERLTIFNLTDKSERDDNCAKIYHKSLLYLVSESFEPKHTPILGMDKYLNKDNAIKRLLGAPAAKSEQTVVYSVGGPARVKLESASTSHGGFDNDPATLNSMLRIVLGGGRVVKEF